MAFIETDVKMLTDTKEIQKLTTSFIFVQSNEVLLEIFQSFSERKGYGIEFISFLFRNEIDESFPSYRMMGRDQVLLAADYPAADEDCEVCLNFDEFYQYLKVGINEIIEKQPNQYNKSEVRGALKKVKDALGV